ncbi:precorrin-2 dehydrogenase/sirohydrochlorin ferrochelatase family protein [Halorarius halobius]|uniref:precorrin-2 dehydrogenase/sirohydrochlorin ferrochelatase family protein n=1 Tax=Halorarius halobius TaxID=2962671 RepID=UPI0020CE3D94|nr:bifunctional precorrin-2 dehydrogenase/sirohydrochlorin ferrochelatase [Halorarius halobius]
MIPLFHDLSSETVLVFGGGRVGARKARRFAREAEVVVVSPAFVDADFGGAERVRAAPDPGDVAGWLDRTAPALVVAATDDAALNARVESEARERGLLVNRTDTHGDRDPGSVVVPATVRDGDVVVAVSTGGASPALAKHLRERIEADIEHAGAMAELTADVRERLQARDVPPDDRRAAVRAVVESRRVWKLLGTARSKARRIADDAVMDVVGDDS